MRLPVRQLVIATGMGSLSIAAFALGWWQEDDARRRATGASTNAAEWRLPKPVASDLSADTTILLARRPFGAAGERANAVAGAAVGPGVAAGQVRGDRTAVASSGEAVTRTPLPAHSPSAFTTTGQSTAHSAP